MHTFPIVTVVVCVFSFGSTALAQDADISEDASEEVLEEVHQTGPVEPKSERLNRISIAPVGLVGGVLGVEYERAFFNKFSAGIGVQLFHPSLLGMQFGLGSTLDLRYHPFAERALTGFWFGTQSQLSAVVKGTGQRSALHLRVAGCAMAGYTWVSEGGFSLSGGAGLGLGYLLRAGIVIAPSAHLNAGYAF